MSIIIYIAAFGLIIWFIRRFIFNPGFTNLALNQFITDSVRSKTFEEISKDSRELYEFNRRRTTAYIFVHRYEDNPFGFIVEFSASTSSIVFFTLNLSKFLRIKNQSHFQKMKQEAESFNYKSFEFVSDKFGNDAICPSCNSPIKKNEQECPICRTEINKLHQHLQHDPSDYEYACSECNSTINEVDKFCTVCGAELDEIISEKEKSDEDNSFSEIVLSKILEKRPEWKEYAEFNNGNLLISIPSSKSGIPPIEIITIEQDKEISVYFGSSHINLLMYNPSVIKSIDDQIVGMEDIVQNIFSEKLISAKQNPGFAPFYKYGLITKDVYEKEFSKGKLDKAFSWKGNYNFPDDMSFNKWSDDIFHPVFLSGIYFNFRNTLYKPNVRILKYLFIYALLACSFFIFNPFEKKIISKEYLFNPSVGDIYEIKTNDKKFSLCKVIMVSDDSVYLSFHTKRITDKSELGNLSRFSGFETITYPFIRGELALRNDRGFILNIERDKNESVSNKSRDDSYNELTPENSRQNTNNERAQPSKIAKRKME